MGGDYNAPSSSEAERVSYGPPGSWIDCPAFTPPCRPTGEQIDGGRCFWLSDTQIDLTGPVRAWFYRSVCEVVTQDGLHEAALIDIDFNPAFERLVFHRVCVIREGVAREVDPTAGMDIFQRERDLERARYDGRLTAHYVIPDVRVGDIVDVAFTTYGAHPLLDRFAAEFRLDWSCWVGETRVRVLDRADRQLVMATWNAPPEPQERRLSGGLVERTWLSHDTPPVPYEEDIPSWVRRFASVRVAHPIGWNDVAERFRGFYEETDPLSDDLRAEIDTLQAEAGSPQRLAVAALRWVQGGLRYQSISIGTGGFVPRKLNRIWASRSGDCKDASHLLSAVLRQVGMDAVPALVNTDRGPVLMDEPPSLHAFNHCIVRLRLDGRTYWLDPTLFPQGGGLDVLHQARFGWALPLVAGGELEAMGEEPSVDVFSCKELYELGPDLGSAATLTVETTYRGWRADGMRRRIESEFAALGRDYVDYYGRIFGDVVAEPISVADDLDANRLVTTERYTLGRPWEPASDSTVVEFGMPDDMIGPSLTTKRSHVRRWPIDVGLPRYVRAETEIRLPGGIPVAAWDRMFEVDGVCVTSAFRGLDERGERMQLVRDVRVSRGIIDPEKAPAYFDLREAALRSSAVTLSKIVENGRFALSADKAASSGNNAWASGIIGIGMLLFFLYIAARAFLDYWAVQESLPK